MKVGDLVETYGWIGVVIKKEIRRMVNPSPSLLIHWIHNGKQVWRYEYELEVLNESR